MHGIWWTNTDRQGRQPWNKTSECDENRLLYFRAIGTHTMTTGSVRLPSSQLSIWGSVIRQLDMDVI